MNQQTSAMPAGGAVLYQAFERLVSLDPGALAVLDTSSGETLSRDQLGRMVELESRCLASVLERPAAAHSGGELGGGRGPIVACQLPNGARLVAVILACWRDGLTPMPLDREMSAAEIEGLCRRLGADALIGSTGAPGDHVAESGDPSRDASLGAFLGDRHLTASSHPPEGTALLKVTSGTTGEPRAVAVSGAALLAGAAQIMSTMGIGAGDVNLGTIPLAHSYGFDNLVLPLVLEGVPLVVARDLTPRRLLANARQARATVMPSVPFLLDLLTRAPGDETGGLPDLRLVISAGAPLIGAVRERFTARFGVRPRTFYGATECGGITFDREGEASLPDGCVGSPLDGVTIELGEGDGDLGRVIVRSPAVAAGYVPPVPDESQMDADSTLGGGRFVTADIGRLDALGRLHLVARASDVINVAGRKVYPGEVERVIRGVPGVVDVVVLSLARTAVAEALRALVVAEPGVDRATIAAACEAALPRYKVPRVIEFRDALPRTARGKLDRRELEHS